MFSAKTYTARRHELRTKIGSGIILLPGNSLSPNNYPNNAYYFRQDSSFRYYFGLNVPSVVGVIDADTGEEALYGDDFTVEDIIWTGPQPTLREMGAGAGVTATFPMAELGDDRSRFLVTQVLDTLQGSEMELHPDTFVLIVDKTVRMATETMHMSIRVRNAARTHRNRYLMQGLGKQSPEIPVVILAS